MALEDETVDSDDPVGERLAVAIRSRLEGGKPACAAACELAAELDVDPIEVGRTADRLQVRLDRCELGLFGYPGHAKGWEGAGAASLPVPEGLEDALRDAGQERSEVSCDRLRQEARRFSVPLIPGGVARGPARAQDPRVPPRGLL
jgi:hypothetical protein